MIAFKQVNKNFLLQQKKITALNNIDLMISARSIYGIVGRSGAGKSTLLRCINLLERPDSGQIYIDGQDVLTMSPGLLLQLRRRIGMIFQHFNLLNSQTVFDNVALPLVLLNQPKNVIKKRVLELLEIVNLTDKQSAYPSQLSGGQKQRVAIARSLTTEPEILLCDEATSALDAETTATILELLKCIAGFYHLTIVLITHQMEVIKQICDQVAVLDQGELIEQAPCYQFFANPKSAIAKQLVASVLKDELPASITASLAKYHAKKSKTILRIFFRDENTQQPIIANLIRTLNMDLNILQAHVEIIQDQSLGVMIVSTEASVALVQQAQDFLTKYAIYSEIIGYVH